MTVTAPPDQTLLHEGISMLLRGIEIDSIRESLATRADDEAQLDAVMKSIRDVHYARRRKRGVILSFIGAALLVFGCVFVICLSDSSGAARFALYAPTGVGAVLVLWGLADVLGW